jgi:hypothetical protein
MVPWVRAAAWVLSLLPAVAAGSVVGSAATASITMLRPEAGGVVPPTFDFGLALELVDPKAFAKRHAEATVCMEMDAEPKQCFDILTSALGASDLAVGEHTVSLTTVLGHPSLPSSLPLGHPMLPFFSLGRCRCGWSKWATGFSWRPCARPFGS